MLRDIVTKLLKTETNKNSLKESENGSRFQAKSHGPRLLANPSARSAPPAPVSRLAPADPGFQPTQHQASLHRSRCQAHSSDPQHLVSPHGCRIQAIPHRPGPRPTTTDSSAKPALVSPGTKPSHMDPSTRPAPTPADMTKWLTQNLWIRWLVKAFPCGSQSIKIERDAYFLSCTDTNTMPLGSWIIKETWHQQKKLIKLQWLTLKKKRKIEIYEFSEFRIIVLKKFSELQGNTDNSMK